MNWEHSTKRPLAAWLCHHAVVKIVHRRAMTSEDTSREWLELTSASGEVRTILVSEWRQLGGEVMFRPDHRSLIEVSDRLRRAVREVEQFEAAAAADIAEFDRLKEKLGR